MIIETVQYVPIYLIKYHVIFYDNINELLSRVNTILDSYEDEENIEALATSDGCVIFDRNEAKGTYRVVVFFDMDKFSVNLCVHESFHLLMEFGRQIGLAYSPESEEAYSYLLAYISEQIMEEYENIVYENVDEVLFTKMLLDVYNININKHFKQLLKDKDFIKIFNYIERKYNLKHGITNKSLQDDRIKKVIDTFEKNPKALRDVEKILLDMYQN